MKILLITDNHTPTGGAEHYFFELKKRLQAIPSLEVYSLGFGPKAAVGKDFFVLQGVRSNIVKLIWQIVFHPGVFLKLRKHLRKIKPDIIHLHNVKQFTASVLPALKPYAVVQTIHDYGVICPVAQNIHKNNQPCLTGLTRSCFWQHQVKYNPMVYLALAYVFFRHRIQLKKIIRHFFAPSPLLVAYLTKMNFAPATYIPPFKPDDRPYSCAAQKPNHFFFAGNLGAHKGVRILLEEFALAQQQNPQLTLTIAGKGPEEVFLRKRIQELKLEKNITLIGWQEDLSMYYEQCTAVIFSSVWMEAFGLVITEAMNRGRAVIGTDRGSPPWLIEDGKTGLIFDPTKKGDLAQKLLLLAQDSALARKLGENAHEKLQTFINNEETLQRIVEVYVAASCIIPSS